MSGWKWIEKGSFCWWFFDGARVAHYYLIDICRVCVSRTFMKSKKLICFVCFRFFFLKKKMRARVKKHLRCRLKNNLFSIFMRFFFVGTCRQEKLQSEDRWKETDCNKIVILSKVQMVFVSLCIIWFYLKNFMKTFIMNFSLIIN